VVLSAWFSHNVNSKHLEDCGLVVPDLTTCSRRLDNQCNSFLATALTAAYLTKGQLLSGRAGFTSGSGYFSGARVRPTLRQMMRLSKAASVATF
jgi:hypothetical protein